MRNNFYIYIITNKSNAVLYTGMTNNLDRRMSEHKQKLVAGFTEKYNVNKLVYYEHFGNPRDAITREKQIKGWVREKKVALIESINKDWDDLSEDFR